MLKRQLLHSQTILTTAFTLNCPGIEWRHYSLVTVEPLKCDCRVGGGEARGPHVLSHYRPASALGVGFQAFCLFSNIL